MRNFLKVDFNEISLPLTSMVNFVSTHFRGSRFQCVGLCIASILFMPISHANSESNWWFNIELIAFKRNMVASNNENFEAGNFDANFSVASNLLLLQQINNSNPLHPILMNLPICDSADDINSSSDQLAIAPGSSIQNTARIQSEKLIFSPFVVESQIAEVTQNLKLLETLALLSDIQVAEPLVANPSTQVTFSADEEQQNRQSERVTRIEQELDIVLKAYHDLTQENLRLDCLQEKSITILNELTEIEPVLVANSIRFIDAKHVLAKDDLVLKELANKTFAQRDIQALLHTAWRENVAFGAENADFIRVRAGKKLTVTHEASFDDWLKTNELSPVNNENDNNNLNDDNFFNHLQTSLSNKDKIDWATLEAVKAQTPIEDQSIQSEFELDGIFKVYLDYVNQVPYLHIESEFKHYRLEIDGLGKSTLSEFPFKQRRRIISKQIHYFDHPAFGIIVRLERFTPPDPTNVSLNPGN